MTEAEVTAHQARVHAGRGTSTLGGEKLSHGQRSAEAGTSTVRPRRAKEPRVKGARRTEVDGISFQSKREAEGYKELKLRLRAGEIEKLKRQVLFPLIVKGVPVYEDGYRADFTYYELHTDGTRAYVVEDRKGHKTEVYVNKAKLMLAIYGIVIRET